MILSGSFRRRLPTNSSFPDAFSLLMRLSSSPSSKTNSFSGYQAISYSCWGTYTTSAATGVHSLVSSVRVMASLDFITNKDFSCLSFFSNMASSVAATELLAPLRLLPMLCRIDLGPLLYLLKVAAVLLPSIVALALLNKATSESSYSLSSFLLLIIIVALSRSLLLRLPKSVEGSTFSSFLFDFDESKLPPSQLSSRYFNFFFGVG